MAQFITVLILKYKIDAKRHLILPNHSNQADSLIFLFYFIIYISLPVVTINKSLLKPEVVTGLLNCYYCFLGPLLENVNTVDQFINWYKHVYKHGLKVSLDYCPFDLILYLSILVTMTTNLETQTRSETAYSS